MPYTWEDANPRGVTCGLCLVAKNRNASCSSCPAKSICGDSFTIDSPEATLQALKNIRKEFDPMDCSKLCANFKPKNESPFPEGLKTEDLRVGTLAENNYGARYVILELLNDRWMKVLLFGGGTVFEHETSFADNGCQPYEDGTWNQSNWLREVK